MVPQMTVAGVCEGTTGVALGFANSALVEGAPRSRGRFATGWGRLLKLLRITVLCPLLRADSLERKISINFLPQVPSSGAQWQDIMQSFETLWNFPNLCGAMDGKHVNVRCPAGSGSQFFNYKKTFSTILFAIVDAHYKFLYIDVGTNGRVNDGLVFSKSTFFEALEDGSLRLPSGAVFVGDDAFPLRADLLKPFSRCGQLNQTQKVFNYRLSRARRCVENAFGLLVARFRIFEKPLPVALGTAEKIVRTCCALHNWLTETSPKGAPTPDANIYERDSLESLSSGPPTLRDLPRPRFTDHSREAKRVRQEYAERFVTVDSVPWQWNMI